jgi:hypothetical protein
MKRILDAINKDLEIKNYYSALYVSLSLIDACARIEYNNHNNRDRYVNWLNQYYLPLYEKDINNPMIPANAIYQLRCSVLHESTNYIDKNSRKKHNDIKDLYRIILTTCLSHRNKAIVHNNKKTIEEIQLSVKIFVVEIIDSVSEWMKNKEEKCKLEFSIETGSWSTTTLDGATGFYNVY